MEAGMRSEQVYWVFTVTVDQMDKFTPLIPKLVAATEKEPGALQFECNIGDDRKTVDFFERYADSKAALFHQNGKLRAILEGVLRCGQAHSLGDLWHALGRVQEGERGLPPDLYDTIRWFCQVTGLASGLKVASLVADIGERLPDAALDPAILSEQS
jgi:quinol monooxygenase YgiN